MAAAHAVFGRSGRTARYLGRRMGTHPVSTGNGRAEGLGILFPASLWAVAACALADLATLWPEVRATRQARPASAKARRPAEHTDNAAKASEHEGSLDLYSITDRRKRMLSQRISEARYLAAGVGEAGLLPEAIHGVP